MWTYFPTAESFRPYFILSLPKILTSLYFWFQTAKQNWNNKLTKEANLCQKFKKLKSVEQATLEETLKKKKVCS